MPATSSGFAGLAYASGNSQIVYEILVFLPLIAAGLGTRRRELVPLSILAGIAGVLLQQNQPNQSCC